MEKELQTKELILSLYDMTKSFTRALQPRYYYQYNGDIDDLASEFFLQFLTPKARKGGKKESLLDKFDPNTTSLAYLVKVCVTRKLIDQSRKNPHFFLSIEAMVEENGDLIQRVFKLSSDGADNTSSLTDPKILHRIIVGFHALPEQVKNKHFVSIFDSQSVLASVLQPTLHYIHGCPIQQITTKTVVLYIPGLKQMVNFSLETGIARGSLNPFVLSRQELESLQEFVPYHSQFSRELFAEYCMSEVFV